jgi:hypothetical protein
MRENWNLLNPSKEEVIRVVEKIVEREVARKEEAENDDEPDPLLTALVNEIRLLRSAVANVHPEPPIVNVAPAAVTVSPPSVSVSPVFHTPVKSWTLEVTSRDPQGKIRTMQFTPQSA